MQAHRVPVIMDVTHALQQPNQTSGVTGGNPQLIVQLPKPPLRQAPMDCSLETHPDPSKALSDGANMLKLNLLESLLQTISKVEKSCH